MIPDTNLNPRASASPTSAPIRIWMATAPVDMRRSFDALAEHVRTFLGHDPLCGHLFVFRNRPADKMKILWWDRNGLVLHYKRLEKGTFQFPSRADKSIALSSVQLLRLLEGLRLTDMDDL